MASSKAQAPAGPAPRYCSQPPQAPIVLPDDTPPMRASAIRNTKTKWVNGTVLHYAFVDVDDWRWPEHQQEVVRWGFHKWRDLNIGLRFAEIANPAEAEIRIGWKQDDGSWSYVGTDVLKYEQYGCTMNFGWDLRTKWGHATALHEIGHTLGFQHEHQNPRAGLVWDEEAVYAHFKRSDNWERPDVYRNIIQKLEANGAEGSDWDPKSIMHYPFDRGLIVAPKPFDVNGIGENKILSPFDEHWALYWYPPNPDAVPIGVMDVARFTGDVGSQMDFTFKPDATRSYSITTVGTSDTKIVLFEVRDGEPRHYDSEDDSGTPDNARINAKLVAGREYIIRARLHYRPPGASTGILIF